MHPATTPRTIVQGLRTGNLPFRLEAGNIAKMSLVARIDPTPEVGAYLEQWEGKKTGGGECPSIPYLTVAPGRYGPEVFANGPSAWIKDGELTLSADRRVAEHRYTEDGVEYLVKYDVEFQRFEESDEKGCNLSGPGNRGGTWAFWGAALVVLGRARRKRN